MEGGSRNRNESPQLLDLIHKGRKTWLMKREGTSLGYVEEKSLELRLAPPGEDWSPTNNTRDNKEKDQPPPWFTKHQTHKFLGYQHNVLSTPSAYQMKPLESSQTCCTKLVGENKNKAYYSQSQPWATDKSSQKSSDPAPVVGWPPVRSFRKNIATSSSAKQAGAGAGAGAAPAEEVNTKEEKCNKSMFVKINMDGVPIGRKVDLSACNGYEKLSSAVDLLFRDLLAGQRVSHVSGNLDKVQDIKEITGLLDGSGQYTLVYEDYEGDRMLVGDVPWDMFILTVKRLRVLKTSKLSDLRGIGRKQVKTSL